MRRATAAPPREVRTFALTDLGWARAARAAAARELRAARPAALLYSTTTAALLWPQAGAIRFDATAAANRPGRHGVWQRPVERRRLAQAPLLVPQDPGALAEAGVDGLGAGRAIVVPIPVEPSGPPAPERDLAAVTYAANPHKKGLDRILDAWRAARRDGEELVVGGVADGPAAEGVRYAGMLAPQDWRALVRRARVYVTAPRREDYGLAQLEALADGCASSRRRRPGPTRRCRCCARWTRRSWPRRRRSAARCAPRSTPRSATGRSARWRPSRRFAARRSTAWWPSGCCPRCCTGSRCSMRAIAIDDFGGPERMQLRELPDPKVGPDFVRIRVQAAGVNPVDAKVRQGRLEGAFPHHFPLIGGWDAAGVVDAVGPAVVGLGPGDEVYAYCRKTEIQWGTYAELVSIPAAAVARRPGSIGVVGAGGIPLAGLTAWQALNEGAELQPGQTVLISAAAGGVGHFAVQLARERGARVVGTASEANHEFVRSLGADAVVDYRLPGFEDALHEAAPDGYDAALDVVGGDGLAAARAVLRPGGRLVSIVDPQPAAGRDDLHGHYIFVRPSATELDELALLVDEERLRVEVARILPLAEAAEAHREIEAGHVRGKLVLEI